MRGLMLPGERKKKINQESLLFYLIIDVFVLSS